MILKIIGMEGGELVKRNGFRIFGINDMIR